MTFLARLEARCLEADSLLCVGLDPDRERHTVDEVAPYLCDIIAATAEFAACFKPNLAFFEQWGIPGLRALEQVLAAIPDGIPVIGDAKRGDVPNTAAAYARALFEAWGFDAVTVSPYLGRDSVEPYLAYRDRGVFVLARTSNPGAANFQALALYSGELLYERIALEAASWGEQVGLVVGATAPHELRRIRSLLPEVPLLVPGVGAQGGSAAEVIAAAGSTPGRVVVNASRSIIYAGSGDGAATAASDAARRLRDELRAALRPA